MAMHIFCMTAILCAVLENVTEKILKSDNINESLKLMFSNLELLSECIDFKGRDFNTLLYNSVYNAKNKKANRFLYYKNLCEFTRR